MNQASTKRPPEPARATRFARTRSSLRGLFRGRKAVAGAPPGHRIYAVGDIHGRADLLERLLNLISHDATTGPPSVSLIFVGDYVDRGPDSKGVIDRLLGPLGDYELHFLRGNHDQVMLEFLADPRSFPQWRQLGAGATLGSYGVALTPYEDAGAFRDMRDELAAKLPPEHLRFLSGLQYFVQIGDYHFVHAGVRPGVALADQSPEDMLWIRNEFIATNADFGKIVVHGHTPMARPAQRPNRIGIDTGAWSSNRLTAVVLEGTHCRFLST